MNRSPMVILCTDDVADPDAAQELANVSLEQIVRRGGGILKIGPAIISTANEGGGLLPAFHPDGGIEWTWLPLAQVDIAQALNPDMRQYLLNCALAALVRAAGNALLIPPMLSNGQTTYALDITPAGAGIEIMAVSVPLAGLLDMGRQA